MSEMLGDDDNPVDFVEANLFNLVDQEARVSGYAYIDEINGKDVRKFSPNFLSERGVELVLDLTPSVEIPVDWGLYISYLLMFISAAIAFVWLGLIEYMQDVLGFDDKNLLEGPYKTAVTHYFDVPNVKDSKGDQGVIFSLEYDPEAKNKKIITGPDGPFCEEHRTKLQSPVHAGDHYTWWCFYKIGDNLRNHIFYLQYDSVEIMKQAREAAKGEIKSL
jgi:hypothetical protein